MASRLVDTDKMVISDIFKHNDEDSNFFIGDKGFGFIRPLWIVLPQMSGYLKYFDNGGKNIFFVIEDDRLFVKCNETWNKIKKILSIKFHSKPDDDK